LDFGNNIPDNISKIVKYIFQSSINCASIIVGFETQSQTEIEIVRFKF